MPVRTGERGWRGRLEGRGRSGGAGQRGSVPQCGAAAPGTAAPPLTCEAAGAGPEECCASGEQEPEEAANAHRWSAPGALGAAAPGAAAARRSGNGGSAHGAVAVGRPRVGWRWGKAQSPLAPRLPPHSPRAASGCPSRSPPAPTGQPRPRVAPKVRGLQEWSGGAWGESRTGRALRGERTEQGVRGE